MAEFNLLNRTGAFETSTMGTRMADPMKEMMAAVAKEKREEIERLTAKLTETDDQDVREGLKMKLTKLRQECEAAERAAGVKPMAVVETAPPSAPTQPVQVAHTSPAPEPITMPKGSTVPLPPEGAEHMTKEQLEALVHELQQNVETLAAQIHQAGPNATPEMTQTLETNRARLLGAMYALAEVTRRENQVTGWAPHKLPEGFTIEEPAPEPVAPKPPSRAALEAQVRELQVELLERAHDAERAPIPAEKEKARLEETRQKLQDAMRQLSQATKNEISELAGVIPPKPTPQQMQEAESLLRHANVAKMRGNKLESRQLVEKAALIAPGSVAVLQVFGDDLADQGKMKQALETYAKALALDPENATLERKYGEALIRSKGMPSPEEYARLMESGLGTQDAASKKSAIIMSLMLPGLGQLVMGRTAFGATLMGVWLTMLAWMSFMPNGLQSVIKSIAGVAEVNPLVFLPLSIALLVHIIAVGTAGSGDGGRKTVERMKPPSDLPFE